MAGTVSVAKTTHHERRLPARSDDFPISKETYLQCNDFDASTANSNCVGVDIAPPASPPSGPRWEDARPKPSHSRKVPVALLPFNSNSGRYGAPAQTLIVCAKRAPYWIALAVTLRQGYAVAVLNTAQHRNCKSLPRRGKTAPWMPGFHALCRQT